MQTREYRFPSATGVCEIAAAAYTPEDGQFSTVLVIHHGMAEHRARYLDFIRFLCAHGVAVYMHDMANHGSSNADFADTGWFGRENDGCRALIEDFRQNVSHAKAENPDKRLVVMGHSMGSFICRLYTARYPQDGYTGAIYMGTGGPNPIAGAGKAAASLLAAVKGPKYKSKWLDGLAFGTYGKGFEGRTAVDWLTRDQAIVDRYVADPYCGFLFTVQGMRDLIGANIASNADAWYTGVRRELPILLVSGALDPVGDRSKGVEAVRDRLLATGHTQVTTLLYPDCRHEVLNELNRDAIMADILAWIDGLAG